MGFNGDGPFHDWLASLKIVQFFIKILSRFALIFSVLQWKVKQCSVFFQKHKSATSCQILNEKQR